MTMHMVNPGLSLINTKKNKKKPSAAQLRAKAEHEAWLRKNGVHPDQLQARPRQTNKLKLNLEVAFRSRPSATGLTRITITFVTITPAVCRTLSKTFIVVLFLGTTE